jgi:hypothetical protein
VFEVDTSNRENSMRSENKWLGGGLLLVASLLAPPASADIPEGLGDWQGHGTRYASDGRTLGEFSVELQRTASGPNSVETRGKIKLATGQVIPFESRMTITGSSFVLESGHGKGGGHCLGADFCYSQEDVGNGKSSAMTIVIDGPNQIRILTTELEHGKPVQFTRQALTKK